jgi:peptidyl-prolyl cis-trans isomerase SurA
MLDDYIMLKNIYEKKEKDNFLNNWIARKQKETYINIDPNWRKCNFQYPGWIK